MPDVAVIDYGVGNLLSVRRGFEHCGARVTVTSEPAEILAASRVVLPGVGAFANAMSELNRFGLGDVVRDVAAKGTPLLGICLGMQMLMDESDEFGTTRGLGLIKGHVVAVPDQTTLGEAQKIPHIGWNGLRPVEGGRSWADTPLKNVDHGDAAYFVHSFMAKPDDPGHRVADCYYGNQAISAVVARDRIIGCQFHPEKSGTVGLRVLRSFLTW